MNLLNKLKSDFNIKYKNSDKIANLINMLDSGNVDYEEAHEFAIEIGEILADVFKNNLSANTYIDTKKYMNAILNDNLGKNYELVADFTKDIQTIINKKAGFNIKGIKAPINQDRIDNMIEKISSEDDFEKVQWLFDEPVKNFTQSVVDDTVKANADFQYKLGMQSKIIRKSTGNCCDWCKALVGEYDYPDEVPKDVYRRHRFCRCTVEHRPIGKKVGTNIHTKKIMNSDDDIEERIKKYEKELNQEEIEREKRRLERIKKAEELKNNVDKNVDNGYNEIKAKDIDIIPKIEYKQVDEKIEKELQKRSDKIWKNKLLGSEQNSLCEYSGSYYGITNRYLRNALYTDDDINWSQTPQRVKELDRALSKNTLGNDLILHRGVSYEEFISWKNSSEIDTYKSTSIDKKVTDIFDDVYKIKIYAPKNTRGIYLGKNSMSPNEKEFLVHRGQKYKIIKIEDTKIEVEFYE